MGLASAGGQVRLAPEKLFRYQATGCRLPTSSSPFYAALMDGLAEECASGNEHLVGLMERMPGTVAAAPVLRLLGGAHRCVLDGVAPSLADTWPGDGRPGDAIGARVAIIELCADPPPLLLAALERDPQTNEVGRAATLGPGLAAIARRTKLPVRLLEIGASAGLLSRLDRYRYEATDSSWGEERSAVRFEFADALRMTQARVIVERRACDVSPIDATTVDGARRLLSYCWPDQTERITRLRGALDIAATMPVTIDTASADEWLDEHMRPTAGVVTVVMHSIMWQYMPKDAQARIERLFADRGGAASDRAPLAHLALEPAPEIVHADLSVTVWPTGERAVLAHSGYHGPPVTWLT